MGASDGIRSQVKDGSSPAARVGVSINDRIVIINEVLDHENVTQELLLEAITGIGLVRSERIIQYLLENGTIPKLFRILRHNFLPVKTMATTVLANIFRVASDLQILAIMKSMNSATLNHFNKIIATSGDQEGGDYQITGVMLPPCFYETLCVCIKQKNSPNLRAGALGFMQTVLSKGLNEMQDDQIKEIVTVVADCLTATEVFVVHMGLSALALILDQPTLVHRLQLLEHVGESLKKLSQLVKTSAWEDAPEEVVLMERVAAFCMQLTQFGEYGVDVLIGNNFVSALMTLLEHSNKKIQLNAVFALFGMCHKGTQDHTLSILSDGFMDKVPGLLMGETSHETKHYTLNALASIMDKGDQVQFDRIFSNLSAFLPRVKQLFEQGNGEMKLETGMFLINLLEIGVKHEMTENEVYSHLTPFNVTEQLIQTAKAFRDGNRDQIMFMRFARAFGKIGIRKELSGILGSGGLEEELEEEEEEVEGVN